MGKNNFHHLSNGTTIVQLTQGKYTILDTSDWELLKQRSWHAAKGGSKGANHYVCTKVGPKRKQSTFFLHRELLNPPEGMLVDHINHDPLDNRRCNLRICTNQENQRNQGHRNNSAKNSRFKGVYYFKKNGKWYSQICIDGKNQYLGYYKTEIEAARAYDEAAKKQFGEFAYLNCP